MSILARYIAQRILLFTGLVLLAVLAVLSVVELVAEAQDVGGDYTFAQALWAIALTTPERAYELLPVCVFVGSLLGLGQMSGESEITALRAAGVGIWPLARVLLAVGLGASLAAIAIGEGVAPAGLRAAEELRAGADGAQRSVWLHRDGRYLHARLGADPARIRDVLVYETDGAGALLRSLHAPEAVADGGAWLLRDVRESGFAADGAMTTTRHASLRTAVLPGASALRLLDRPPDAMSGADLARYLRAYAGDGADVRRYRFAWWQRLATPLSCIVVLLLTVPFALAQGRGGGLGQRVFLGVISGLAIYVFNRIAGHSGMLWGLSPAVSTLLPLVCLFLLGAALLTAQHRSWLRRRPAASA